MDFTTASNGNLNLLKLELLFKNCFCVQIIAWKAMEMNYFYKMGVFQIKWEGNVSK